jgi:hypothetical protein
MTRNDGPWTALETAPQNLFSMETKKGCKYLMKEHFRTWERGNPSDPGMRQARVGTK